MSIATQSGATNAISTIDAAMSYVQAERSNLGAVQNRLTYTVDNLTNARRMLPPPEVEYLIPTTLRRQLSWRERNYSTGCDSYASSSESTATNCASTASVVASIGFKFRYDLGRNAKTPGLGLGFCYFYNTIVNFSFYFFDLS